MMHTKVRSGRAAMLASASLAMAVALISPGTMVAARDFPDLPDYKLMLDSTWAWGISPGAENPADLSTPTGTWTVTPSPIADGILDLHVRLETPRVSLPV